MREGQGPFFRDVQIGRAALPHQADGELGESGCSLQLGAREASVCRSPESALRKWLVARGSSREMVKSE